VNGARRRTGRIGVVATQVAFVGVVLALWYLATERWGVSRILLPNPVAVWHALVNVIATGEFLPDLRITLFEVAVAFAISATSGVMVGFLVSRSLFRTRVFEPLFAAMYAVPLILFIPLYVLWFGLGSASKIAVGATISFFPVALNTITGFAQVDRGLVTAARSMGATGFALFRFVLLPGAFPVILAGMRLGFTVALLSVIGTEVLASLAGLGHHIVELSENMEPARMFAYVAFVVAIAGVLNFAVSMLEAWGRRW
jgi:ABC-type nitrate/sulfonate/bicarbonate transport system permease component